MMNSLISVVIPIYNAEPYLTRTLNSITNQTYKNLQIICVDDGSTDGSLNILKSYAKEDPRIIIIHGPNEGPGAARNKGLNACKGEFISILDADDVYELNMYEVMVSTLISNNADIVICKCDSFDNQTGITKPIDWSLELKYAPSDSFSAKDLGDNVFKFCTGWSWDKLYRSNLIRDNHIKFQTIRHSDDAFFSYITLFYANKITFSNNVLIHHRTNVTGSTSKIRTNRYTLFYEAIKKIKDELCQMGQYPYYERAFINWALHFSLWNYNTDKGFEREDLLCFLINTVFRELEISNYPPTFFMNEHEYAQYLQITKDYSEKERIKISFHGSYVSMAIAEHRRDIFTVRDNVQYQAIESLVSNPLDVPGDVESAATWENNLIKLNFNKNARKKLFNSQSDLYLIDLIDERYPLCDIHLQNQHGLITYSPIISKYYSNIHTGNYLKSMWTIIPKQSYPILMVKKAIREYATELLKVRKPESIVIIHAYFVESYRSKSGEVVPFTKDILIDYARTNRLLKSYYSWLSECLPGANHIYLPKSAISDESHKYGASGIHYSDETIGILSEELINVSKHIKIR